jgi:predicted MFS family arabinose efflux permease
LSDGRRGWRAVFVSTALLGALALLLAAPGMSETRDPHAVGVDWPGMASFWKRPILAGAIRRLGCC